MDAAEQDKERYTKEFNEYKQTESYKIFIEKQAAEKKKGKKKEKSKEKNGTHNNTSSKSVENNSKVSVKNFQSLLNHLILSWSKLTSKSFQESKQDRKIENGIYEIPIFTEEFLEHNKGIEELFYLHL